MNGGLLRPDARRVVNGGGVHSGERLRVDKARRGDRGWAGAGIVPGFYFRGREGFPARGFAARPHA